MVLWTANKMPRHACVPDGSFFNLFSKMPRHAVDQEHRAQERIEREHTRRGNCAAARARSLEMLAE